jgi:uncharacterized membrane protein
MIDILQVIEIASLFFAGLLAGEEFVMFYGVRRSLATLDAIPQLQVRQALIHRLKILVPAIFVPTILLGIASTIAVTFGLIFVLRCVGLIGLVAWALATLPGTAPINSAIAEWDPKAPPENWKETVDRWERFASVRPWGAMFGFVMFLIAIVR